MAAVQETPWLLHRHQSYPAQLAQRDAQYATNQAAYAYSHASPSMSPPMMSMPMMYQWDHQPHNNHQQWNHHHLPPYTLSPNQAMLPMPMPLSNQRPTQSVPTPSGPWQPSPMFWQTPVAHIATQINSQHTGMCLSVRSLLTSFADEDNQGPVSPQHGPPRRPIQSKHALWVGNIPTHATIISFRDHFFIPETADDILSVVFTPMSNSGFVNFRTDEACRYSMKKFNKSFFYGVPLNCRSRKPHISTSPTVHTVVPGPSRSSTSSTLLDSPVSSTSSMVLNQEGATESKDSELPKHSDDTTIEHSANDTEVSESTVLEGLERLSVKPDESRNRYFIIKSLTNDDLINSTRSNRWSTQLHNEHILDEAFKNGDSVYLIFSVNRSREYFGYAQMTSATTLAPAPIVTSTPLDHFVDQSQMASKPPIVSTPATGLIPAGRIVDELCRGKVFWEIDDVEHSSADHIAGTTKSGNGGLEKSFSIKWLKVKRVPFRQTTHLRNTMNDNKEVKIARDGTELDGEVGRTLCGLFHASS